MLHGFHKFNIGSSFQDVFQRLEKEEGNDVRKRDKDGHVPIKNDGVWISFETADDICEKKGGLQANHIQKDKIVVLEPPG